MELQERQYVEARRNVYENMSIPLCCLLLPRNRADQNTWVCNLDRIKVIAVIDAEIMGEEAVAAYFNVLSRHSAGDTEAQKYLSI